MWYWCAGVDIIVPAVDQLPPARLEFEDCNLIGIVGPGFAALLAPGALADLQKGRPQTYCPGNHSFLPPSAQSLCRQASASYPAYCWEPNATFTVVDACFNAVEPVAAGKPVPAGYIMAALRSRLIYNFIYPLSCVPLQGNIFVFYIHSGGRGSVSPG